MSKEDDNVANFCPYCGASYKVGQIYCPKCGKLVVKIKPTEKKPPTTRKEIPTRTCSNCGSIITSNILEQCPICNAKLEKLPKEIKTDLSTTPQKKAGLIYSNKKLVPEQRFVLKRGTWNFREGLAVFGNSLMIYMIVRISITFLITLQLTSGTESIPISIETILISQIPDILFGLYPIWYIYSKKHNFKKLSLFGGTKSTLKALLIGLIGALVLFGIDTFSSELINYLSSLGIDFSDISSYISEQSLVLRNAGFLWILLLSLLFSLSVISTEIVFRGVLHNTLSERFEKNLLGRITVIVIIALIYSSLFLLFTYPIFFISNFLIFTTLGIIFEINHNLLNSIFANVIYNIFLLVIIVYF